MTICFLSLRNNNVTKNAVLCRILLMCLLMFFCFSVSAQQSGYTLTVPSLLMKDKTYTFSIKKSDNSAVGSVVWNFGTDAQPSTSTQPVVEVKYGVTGTKQITLTVSDAANTFTVNRQVYVSEFPDNIEEVGCYIKPATTNWKPQMKKKSDAAANEENKVHILAQPFVGDIDGDGASEVVVTNKIPTEGYTYSNRILIFDNELRLKRSIPTPRMYSNAAFPVVLLRLQPTDNDALIVIATADTSVGYKLQAYKSNGTLVWTSAEEIFSPGSSSERNASVSLVAGDINNDGIPEILAGDRIFNAQNGGLVSTLPAGGRGYRMLNSGNPTYMPLLADMDNDGRLEAVTGKTIYKVTNSDGSFKTTGEILSQRTDLADGFVSVADIDGDGQLDVVSIIGSIANGSKPRLAVWTLQSGQPTRRIIAGPVEPSYNGSGGSRVFIGNVDNDVEPELFFSYENRLVRFDYNKNGSTAVNKLQQTWNTTTSDASGATTLSMFDFDHDGKAELVYRDMTDLRIVDGANGANRQTFPCFSATHSEYPVIVDFDRDGHADILVSGSLQGQTTTDVRLYWFSGDRDAWAPARTVWNQHAYNAVHVNEDLTIPRFQLNPATAFAGQDKTIGTTDDVYPYNCFLQQQTSLSGDGIPYFKAPRADFIQENVTYDYDKDTDKLLIRNITVKNSGDAVFTGPMKITVYKNQVVSPPKFLTRDYPNNINIGQTVSARTTNKSPGNDTGHV